MQLWECLKAAWSVETPGWVPLHDVIASVVAVKA